SYRPESVRLTARAEGEGFVLTGKKMFVRDADAATAFLVAGRTEEGETEGPGDRGAAGMGGTRPLSSASAPGAGTGRGGVAVSVVGACGRVLESCTEYAKQRVQFGRPIGSFQAIQHKLAVMATENDGARLLAYRALWTLAEGLGAERLVAMAKAFGDETGHRT